MRFAKDRDAFERYGFITLENHGLEQDLIDQTYGEAERFFALPEASKLEASIPGVGGNFGYTPFGREHAKDETRADLKDFYHFAQRHYDQPECPEARASSPQARNWQPHGGTGGRIAQGRRPLLGPRPRLLLWAR